MGGSGAALEGVNEACILRAQGKLISRATPKVPQMTRLGLSLAGSALYLLAGSYLAFAQAPLPGGPRPQRHSMRFFVTSVGPPGGAICTAFRADAHCTDLAQNVCAPPP
jgi:hypothetical protein